MVVDSRSLASRLKDRLRELILDGSLSAGAQLPTEPELAGHFRVSRATVREALKQLENEGTVIVRRGRGRFVSSAPVLRRPITRLESVTALLASHGYEVENRVLSAAAHRPTAEEPECLRLASADQVFRLERLRLHDGEPLIYSVDVLPAEHAGSGRRRLARLAVHGTRRQRAAPGHLHGDDLCRASPADRCHHVRD